MARTLLLDANLAVLFVVGTTNAKYIRKHKRLAAYDTADFEAVCELISLSSGLVFTPNVLSETPNLIRYIADPIRSEIAAVFAEIIRRVGEQYVPSPVAVDHPDYLRLGITDAVLLSLAHADATLLTTDLDLFLAATRSGLPALNYNHIRNERPDDRS